MNRLRDCLAISSKVKYALWRARTFAARDVSGISLHLKSGENIFVRPKPSTDMMTAYEIFVARVYEHSVPPDLRAVRRIVDLGGNVGYSVIYWARRYPEARITVFEPHPRNVVSLRKNVSLNALDSRVDVREAAAFNHESEVFLTDNENSSTVVRLADARSIRVRAVDFFETVAGETIDILKMDIEGGEYSLLSDQRFASLKPRAIAMEWHQTAERPDALVWCERTLGELGYVTSRGDAGTGTAGLLWAHLPEACR